MATLRIHSIKINYRSIAVWALAISQGLLLIYAATKKAMDLKAFAAHIEVLPYITTQITYVLTALVLLIEIVLAFLLVLYPIKRGVYLTVITLMAIYSAYIYAVLHHALILPCSCQGAFKSLSWEQHYLVNAAVAVVALTSIALVYRSNKQITKHK